MSEEKKEEAISRRKYLGAVGGLGAAAIVGWGVAGYALSKPPAPAAVKTVTETKTITVTPTVTPVATPVKKPGEGYTFVFIGHWTAGPFAAIVQKGFMDAIEELGAKGEFYMAEGNISRQTDLIRTAVVKKVDGIATTIVDPTAFDVPIKEAIDAGINVISANSDDPEGAAGNPRKAFIGQTFYTAGLALGEKVAKEAVQAGLSMKEQRAAIFTSFITSPWHAERGRGIRDAIVKYGVDPKKIEDVDCVSEEMATAERIQTAYLTKNRDVKLAFGTDAIVTDRFASSAKAAGIKPGEVFFGGFDVTPATIDGIEAGYILATITQQPYLQGYYAVYQLYIMKKYGFAGSDIDTGKGLVDKTNVELFKKLAPLNIMG
ncbi:MAG: substrate-binding domain-containing protein [Candidatus Omnitrophica bacterium]|nr:substrate-binding domain-containing protein [Candidatus Omnitrophota bacterium]